MSENQNTTEVVHEVGCGTTIVIIIICLTAVKIVEKLIAAGAFN